MVIAKPREDASEFDKFDDNGKWFLENARWYVYNYYNTYSVPNAFTLNSGSTTSGIVTGNGMNITNTQSTSIVDDMLKNYEYYYGNQDNRIFNHLTIGTNNNPLPNVWIKGQEVRSLVDHIIGKAITLINPIEDNISCESISENAVIKRKEVFDRIDIAAEIGDALSEMTQGMVEYKPAGDINYSDPSEVKEAKEKIRQEYMNTATIIARSAYFKNNLAEMFKDSAKDTAICNLTGIHFREKDGELMADYIPGYASIFDYSTWGEHSESQDKGGFIFPVTYEEVLREYPDMNPTWKQEMEDVLYNKENGVADFIEYYNQPFQNVKWWYNNQKWMSKAVVYWVAPCDTRYKKVANKYGNPRIKKIDDFKDYYDPSTDASNLPPESKMIKGKDLKGDTRVYRVHYAVILANKYLLEYGYEKFQVRPYGDRRKPIIPIISLCQGKLAGYVKPIVSRLRPKQDELDAIRYKIREYAAKDMGKVYVFGGGKLGESLTAGNIVNDFKTLGVTVLPPTGDAATDALGARDLVNAIDMSNHDYITQYLTLKRDIDQEMKNIVNLTDISLGSQSGVIGKGVQEETIARSELSGMSLYSSLSEYWRRVLQYAANKSKLIMIDSGKKNVILPLSVRENKLITLTKEMRFEDLMVYLNANDAVENNDKALLRQILISYSINPTIEAAEAIANTLKMIKFKSLGEGISMFEGYIEDKKKENEQKQMREMTAEQAQVAQQQQSAQILESQKQIASLYSKLAEIEAKGAWDVKGKEVQAGIDKSFQYDDMLIKNISDLVSQQLLNVSPPQGQAPPPQGMPPEQMQQPQQEATQL